MTDRDRSPGEPSLLLQGAGKRFDDTWVLRDVDLEVAPGTIVGLIGPSGCGKTTTLRLATGVHRPDEGTVRLLGRRPDALPSDQRQRLGYLPQEPVLFEELSLWENLAFHAALNGVRLRSRAHRRRLLELVELDADRRKAVNQASGGMKRRLALAAALVHEPSFIILDEPTAGIDPVLRRTFWEHFRSLRDEGRTFVITTQYVGEAADCDLVVLLAGGRVVATGPPEELRRQAVGGDLLEIETDREVPGELIERLRRRDDVHRVDVIGPARFRLLVDDGGAALAEITTVVQEAELAVVDTEEPVPSYDEVFIQLVEANEADRPAVPA